MSRVQERERKGNREEGERGKEERECAVPFFSGFLPGPSVLLFRSAVPLVRSVPSFRFHPLRSARCVSFLFPFLCCAAVLSRFVSVSVLLSAGKDRTGQQRPQERNRGHGVRLRRNGTTRDERGGAGGNRHFVNSLLLRAYCSFSVTLFIRVTLRGGGIPFRSPILVPVPWSLLGPFLFIPFRPACSRTFRVKRGKIFPS